MRKPAVIDSVIIKKELNKGVKTWRLINSVLLAIDTVSK